jgi:hypothetical protein
VLGLFLLYLLTCLVWVVCLLRAGGALRRVLLGVLIAVVASLNWTSTRVDFEKVYDIQVSFDKTPPSVTSINWTPTRVILDKVYDINVSFTAIDDENPIAYAELHFVPVEYYYMVEKYGMRPEDYPKVFPPDRERVFVLTPVDGKFDSLKEEFSVQIRDIVGGREYKIVALVKDLAGNEKIVEVKTPYIRQFENVAKADDILVVTSYMPWYTDPKWVTEHNFRGYPLLGAYNVRDPIIIYKHADWATGHGIDAFLMNWNGADKSGDENIKYIMETLKDFKGSPKIGILWGPHPQVMTVSEDGKYDMNYLPNKEEFLREMDYLATIFMKNPNYLTTNDGRPIIYFYESKALKGDIPQLILDARNIIRGKVNNPFIIGDEIGWLFTYPEDWLKIEGNSLTRLLSFDAISDWAGSIDRSKQEYIDNYETYLDILYNRWSSFLRNYNTIFVGSAITGFWYNPNIHPYTEYSLRLSTLKSFAESQNLQVVYEDDYALEEFIRQVVYREDNRCPVCY